jgi:hypothetical protein
MLIYLIMAELTKKWKNCGLTTQEGIAALSATQIRMPASIKPIDNRDSRRFLTCAP